MVDLYASLCVCVCGGGYIKLIDMGIVSPLWVVLFPRLGAMACLEIKMSKSKQESKHVYKQFSLFMVELN